MGSPKKPEAVKLFVALLCRDEALFPLVERDLAAFFGTVDSASPILPWRVTRYYEKEMGPDLLRRFVSFGPLISPGQLPEIKLKAHGLEKKYQWVEGERSGRGVNIDPGYLEGGKLVLASTKNASQRIYLSSGIYGEVTLAYRCGSFQPLANTYPDYRWPETLAFFSHLRALYRGQLRQGN